MVGEERSNQSATPLDPVAPRLSSPLRSGLALVLGLWCVSHIAFIVPNFYLVNRELCERIQVVSQPLVMAIQSPLLQIIPLLAGVVCMIIAGVVTSGISPRAPIRHAILVGVLTPLCMVASAQALAALSRPVDYLLVRPSVVLLFFVPLTTFLVVVGACLRTSKSHALRLVLLLEIVCGIGLVLEAALIPEPAIEMRGFQRADAINDNDNGSREHKPHNPRICVGYQDGSEWGAMYGKDCDSHHGVIATELERGRARYRRSWELPLRVTCCPLPAEDILTAEVTFSPEKCPQDFVVTSGTAFQCDNCTRLMRCTRINTERYQLGLPVDGLRLSSNTRPWESQDFMIKGELPVSIRYAVGRESRFQWSSNNSCIGNPPGSLLVGRVGKECAEHTFAQLQYRGSEGDPKRGTPVQMFPNCGVVADIYSPDASCN